MLRCQSLSLFARLVAGLGCALALSVNVGAAEAPSKPNRAEQVAAHLEAGEFGPALELATKAASPTEQADLLNNVATAQQNAGEASAATGTMRRASRTGGRGRGAGQQSGTGSFGGGGVIADFTTLMTLIQENTSGKWEIVDGEGGTMSPFPTGVRVAPNGLLHRLSAQEHTGELASLGASARKADLNADVARRSDLRMVSLTRLEKAVSQRLADGQSVPETMAQLAGLSQVKYVFVYPEANEIVLAGPAEGWQYNANGQPVALSNGRPTLQLDDLVTVLRTFARGDADFGCLIATRDAGVRAATDFSEKSQAKGAMNSTSVRGWVNQLQQKLGRQDIQVWGVPGDSRVARVIVEADYRMKLIGIDKLDAGKEIPSYFDLLTVAQQRSSQPMEALRWWLTMKYDGLSHSADKSAFEIHGSSVLCQSENQLLTADGKHLPTGQSETTNRLFAQNFTTNYDKLAARDLVFADTQNVFDLALVSALIQHENLDDKAKWDMGSFAPHGAYTPARYAVPKEVDSVVNHRVYGGKYIVVQAAGGVKGDVMSVVKSKELNTESPRLGNVAQSAKASELPAGRWWWDAAR